MNLRAKWFLHQHYLALITALVLACVGVAVFLYISRADWRVSLTVIGGLISGLFLIQKQQLDEAKFVNELFIKFNSRYDALNEALNLIKAESDQKALSVAEEGTLHDYFNLCGEEYLFHKRGYIYPEVWQYWVAGMKIFFDNPRIRRLWLDELKTSSYYGLEKEIGNLVQNVQLRA